MGALIVAVVAMVLLYAKLTSEVNKMRRDIIELEASHVVAQSVGKAISAVIIEKEVIPRDELMYVIRKATEHTQSELDNRRGVSND